MRTREEIRGDGHVPLLVQAVLLAEEGDQDSAKCGEGRERGNMLSGR